MPTIIIDDEVYHWLQSQATPFEDSPNTVLRRIKAGLEARSGLNQPETTANSPQSQPAEKLNASVLIARWGLQVVQGRCHREGRFYENLTAFPGALFDANGYVVFETEDEYRNCEGLSVKAKTNVAKPGIRSLSQYKRMV